MLRPKIRNHSFDRMGESYAPLIDRDHFLGRSALDPRRPPRQARVNIKKGENIFQLEVAVPGFAKEDLSITIKNELLIIRGEKKQVQESDTSDFILKEFDADFIERTFVLTNEIGHEEVQATYLNGVLKITFFDVPEEEENCYKKVEIT